MSKKTVQVKEVMEITCLDLKKKMEASDPFVLIDVREPDEFETCQIPGSILIPFSELEDHLEELDKQGDYVLHCKMGGRSIEALAVMKHAGFDNVKILKGGIFQWVTQIDPSLSLY